MSLPKKRATKARALLGVPGRSNRRFRGIGQIFMQSPDPVVEQRKLFERMREQRKINAKRHG